jgi:hypothetical protein
VTRVNYSYSAYGLVLASDALLPGLPQHPGPSATEDVVLTVGAFPDWVREASRLPSYIELPVRSGSTKEDSSLTLTHLGNDDFFELSYAEGARFVIDRAATRIWGTWSSPLTIEDAATFLLGPVLGFVLRRRGTTALHASAVGINGHAVVLCGESEAGKSTTVAALALTGFPVLAEDVSAVKQDPNNFYILPGYPRVCLWPDSVETLFGSADALSLLTPTWEKRFLPLDDRRAKFESQRQPLGAIYIFAPRSNDSRAPYIEPLSQRVALLELVQNTYMNWLLDRSQRAAELDLLTKIVSSVPVRRIIPHADPARLSELRGLIASDAAALLSTPLPIAEAILSDADRDAGRDPATQPA